MELFVSLPAQTLELFDDRGDLIGRYLVSTATNGAGEASGSYRTPRGRHAIRAMIGRDLPENAVFVRRRPTGETWSPELARAAPRRDWILTRILWLCGREPGFNRFGQVDTMRRYIYIHGCPDTAELGIPGSHGCIRMRNRDIVELFERVLPGAPLLVGDYRVVGGDWAAMAATAHSVRQAVFVDEHGIDPVLEWDDLDRRATHVVAFDGAGHPIGTGRLAPDGRIGRLAVAAAWRGKGVGQAMLRRLLAHASQRGLRRTYLHARTTATPFYRRFGFVQKGGSYLETGSPHVTMERAPGKS